MTASHRPRMSAERAEQIRRWHLRAYEAMRAEAGSAGRDFDYLGLSLHVPPEVQPITAMSSMLGEAVLREVRPHDRVLDMGTGSGVNALLAATIARGVLAVDVSTASVEAARANAVRNGLSDRVTVRQSDVFDAVSGRYDVIIFDPPFRWFRPRDALEAAMTDENYSALTRFFQQAPNHLTDHGRVLVFFGTTGDSAYLEHLIRRAGFTATELARKELSRDGQTVAYFSLRLSLDRLSGPGGAPETE